MKTISQTKVAYEAPQIEVLEVEVEKGFAGSDNSSFINEFGDGGDI